MSTRIICYCLPVLLCTACVSTPPPAKTVIIPAGYDRAYDDYHYSPVVRVGDTVIVSGIPAGGAGTYEEQIRRMFERLKVTLAAAGADISDVVEITTFHQNVKDTQAFDDEFDRFLKVYDGYFPNKDYPAWTAVGGITLLSPGAPVEMRAVAVVGSGKHVTVKRDSAAH
jgi:enamine deaminase RidA (YjgF/YER057c/UK114 family)